jgi:hypothetical protein
VLEACYHVGIVDVIDVVAAAVAAAADVADATDVVLEHVAADVVADANVVADDVACGAAGATSVANVGSVVVVAVVVDVFPLRDVVNNLAVAHVFVFNPDGNDEGACPGTH